MPGTAGVRSDYTKTKILTIKGSWQEVVDDCRITVGKPELGHEPSTEFKRKILIAEHSPIRNIEIRWIWHDIKSWIATHWVRHRWECFVKSQRSDRTGVDRDELPQNMPVDFTGIANAQHLIDTWRKRLCRQAHEETRAYAEDFKATLREIEPEISNVLVPNCIYRCGCPEEHSCWFWSYMRRELQKRGVDMCSIQERYAVYNDLFYRKKKEDGAR